MKKDFKFDERASSYDKGFEGKLSKRFYALLLNEIELNDKDEILDIGCGTGEVLKQMSNMCEIIGYGIDVEENMIKEAQMKCPNMNIQVSNSDKIPFENSKFDIVTCCMAYHHFDNQIGFAKEANRIMKLGAYLYIVDPNFPLLVRKLMNLVLRLIGIVGKFETYKEIYNTFEEHGFELSDFKTDKYAQLIKLRKIK